MMATLSSPRAIVHVVEALADTQVTDCYQCGKCTAGCPMGEHMGLPPTLIIRLLQLGDAEPALRSDSIWQCVSCQTCSTRCPKNVDCAAVMDALRQLSAERGTASSAQNHTIIFQKAFLDNIRRNGRLNEIELIARFKGQVFFRDRSLPFLFRDASLAGQLHKRRKLHLTGEKVRDRGVVERIFAHTTGGGV